MPRIRKKTSRRGTTAKRASIKDKVRESRKKAKKAAKKDVTWKSKKAKDPGIPNNFPYKDQILAEIAEDRRQAAEAKARRKEEKKSLRAQQKGGGGGANGSDDSDGGENIDDAEESGFDGVVVTTSDGRAKKTPSKSKKSADAATTTTTEEEEPLLKNAELPHLAAVLDKADVVIEILDTRDPLSHRSKALETQVSQKEGQMLLFVLNKIDGCPRESTAAWAAHLRAEHPTVLFRAASAFLPPVVRNDPTTTKGKGKEKTVCLDDDAWGVDAVCALLGRWADEKKAGGDGRRFLHVAVVGLTNSGKSAFVNSLARKRVLDVYAPSSNNRPTTTPYAVEVTLELDGKPVVFIDTPGLSWQSSEDSVQHRHASAQDVLLRNKGRIDHLKDPIPAVSYIVSRAETEDLMVHYCLPAFAKGDVDAFLLCVARANALVKRGGDPDLVGAARLVLRDWSTGKLPRYAVPPPIAPRQAADRDGDSDPTLYTDDTALLERLVPRKELRRSLDLVRLSSGQVDERALALDTPWFGSEGASSGMDEEGEVTDDGDGDESTQSSSSSSSDDVQASIPAGDGGRDGDMVVDGNEDEVTGTGATRSSSAQKKRKLPPSSKTPVDAARRPNKTKKVAFAAAVTSPPASTAADTGKKKRSTLKPASKRNDDTSSSTPARGRASAAQQDIARRRTGGSIIKPAANAPTTAQKKQKNQAAAAAASEEGSYDFSKFF